MNKNKKLGFTLAEVLIVIGIIGVVAALTLPNLNHATGDKETVTRVKKAYSMLNEATDRAQAIYGPIAEWDCSAYDGMGGPLDICWMTRIKDFLKISQICNEFENSDSSDYVSCDSIRPGNIDYDGMILKLTDGLTISTNGFDCGENTHDVTIEGVTKYLCSNIYVDIDGQKGKNQYGKDQFSFGISRDGMIVSYDDCCNSEDIIERTDDCMSAKDHRCTYWVIEHENLDYLKADNTGKCNDSNIVLNGVTNTSCH